MRKVVVLVSLFFVLFFAGVAFCLLQEGERAPNFQLRDTQEKIVSLNWFCGDKIPQAQRKTVVLNFFQTTCKPCLEELPAIKRFYTAWKNDSRVTFFMIGCGESTEQLKKFQQEQNASELPMLSDRYLMTCKSYGVTAFPITMVIDGAGVIRVVIKERRLDLDEVLTNTLKKMFGG